VDAAEEEASAVEATEVVVEGDQLFLSFFPSSRPYPTLSN